MELVVDANVLLAGFMKAAVTRELLLDHRLSLHAPEHLIYETRKHLLGSSRLRERIRLSPAQIEEIWFILTKNIESHAQTDYQKAYSLALKIAPHPEDAPESDRNIKFLPKPYQTIRVWCVFGSCLKHGNPCLVK